MQGGGTKAIVRDASPAYDTTHDPASPFANSKGDIATSNVDLSTEIVNALQARVSFAANALVLKVSDQMMQDLLDIPNHRRTDVRI